MVTSSSENSHDFAPDEGYNQPDFAQKVLGPEFDTVRELSQQKSLDTQPSLRTSSLQSGTLPGGGRIKKTQANSISTSQPLTKGSQLSLSKNIQSSGYGGKEDTKVTSPRGVQTSKASYSNTLKMDRLENNQAEMKQVMSKLKNNFTTKSVQNEIKPTYQDDKDELLAKFRSDRRSKVRTAIAEELSEIRTRLDLIASNTYLEGTAQEGSLQSQGNYNV